MAYIPPNPNGQATKANSAPVVLASDQNNSLEAGGNLEAIANNTPVSIAVNPGATTSARPVRLTPNPSWRSTFAAAMSGGVDTAYMTVIKTGSGQTINQTSGNLVLTTGTTANSETIIRSNEAWDGSFLFRYQMLASQRIANQNLYMELVDVIGDGLSYTINSATSVTVTIPSNTFTSANVGQSMYMGGITGAAGIPGRFAIASVSGNNVTFTVASWPASGSGTLSLFGWNYYQIVYTGTTATNALFDGQRRGYNSGATTATINTSASPGHIGQIYSDDGIAVYSDGLAASNTGFQFSQRASRLMNVPAAGTNLYLQIRSLNGTSAPASTTTWTVGFVAVEEFVDTPVTVRAAKQVGGGNAMSVQVQNTPSVTLAAGTAAVGTVSLATGATTDITSAAITTTTTSSAVAQSNLTSVAFVVACTALSGTTPTLDVVVQESWDATNWVDLYHFERIATTGHWESPIMPLTGQQIRYVRTVAGTSPSFTMALTRISRSSSPPPFRNYFDRALASSQALSATTGTYYVAGCKTLQMVISSGAATTACVIQMQGSADGSSWYSVGSTLTSVASSAVSTAVNTFGAKYVRGIVTTAGSGQTLNYVNFVATG